jgi:hypothetical protein
MRIVFFLLLFINLIFAAYIQWGPGASSRVQLAAELHPERIKPLSALPEPVGSAAITPAPVTPAPVTPAPVAPAPVPPQPAAPAPVAPGPMVPPPTGVTPDTSAPTNVASSVPASAAPAAPATCLEWGKFLGVEHARMEAAMARRQLDHDAQRIAVGKKSGYWVYIPPLRNREHAVRKMGELGRLGLTNYYRVEDNGQWNNAISMGFFDDEDEADDLLEELRGTGVRSAVMGKRSLEQIKFVLRDPPQDVVEKMKALKAEFPGSELKTIECDARPKAR